MFDYEKSQTKSETLFMNSEREMPLVSIIMNCYNGEKYLQEAILSVINQKYTNWEVVFWDNGSIDASEEIIKSFNDSRIKYCKAEKFTSLGEARNLAIKKACGLYIAFLDVDDVWLANKLEMQVEVFERDLSIGLVHCNYISFWEGGSFVANPKKEKGKESFGYLIKNYRVGMSAAIIRKSIIDKYKISFDSRYSLVEDYDFFLNVAYYSNVHYLPESLMRYRIHSESLTNKNLSKWGDEFLLLNESLKELLKDKVADYKNELDWIYVRAVNSKALGYLKENKRFDTFVLVFKNLRVSLKLVFLLLGVIVGFQNYTKITNLVRSNNYRFN
jgi:glycosyltransferase involved in cell wall biosynthesis